MLQAPLFQKYDKKFNFFFAKPISEIVFNRTSSNPTLDYKDIVIFSQTNEYLKRTYHIKNSAGRNQIYDRIRMLADFYFGATMLKYEHPMMIVTNTKDIFLKRLKRTKKMIASDCSSQQSSEQRSQHSSQIKSFSSSRFLRTISSSQLEDSEEKSSSLIQTCQKKKQRKKSYDSEIYDIYAQKAIEFKDSKSGRKSEENQQISRFKDKLELGIEHLIIDIDDVDKELALVQYKKIKERENIQDQNQVKKRIDKKSSIIITPLENYIPREESESSGAYNNYYPKNVRNMKKHPSNYRYNDQTIRVSNYNIGATTNSAFNSNNTKQIASNRSPSFGAPQRYGEGEFTERNYMLSPSYTQSIQKNDRLDYLRGENRRPTRERTTTQEESNHISMMPRKSYVQSSSSLLNQQDVEHETIYLTNENSLQNSKINKKNYIRQKAVALLQKVRSQQKLAVFHEQPVKIGSKNILKYSKQDNNRYHKYRVSKLE